MFKAVWNIFVNIFLVSLGLCMGGVGVMLAGIVYKEWGLIGLSCLAAFIFIMMLAFIANDMDNKTKE